MLGKIDQDMVFPERGTGQCKGPGVRRNGRPSRVLSLGGREAGSRYADGGLQTLQPFRLILVEKRRVGGV